MDKKTKLKERLLEIPFNSRAYREKHRLADELNIELKYIEFYLNELCEKKILKKKIQYICPNCRDTTTLSDDLLNEVLEDDSFECDNCENYINPQTDTTGFVYYDITDTEKLENW